MSGSSDEKPAHSSRPWTGSFCPTHQRAVFKSTGMPVWQPLKGALYEERKMTEHIVYSDLWTDAGSQEGVDRLRLSISFSNIGAESLPSEQKSFAVGFDAVGFIQFDFLTFLKGQVIYQATGLHQCAPDQLPLPLVKLVAEPLLAAPSRFR